MKSHERTERTKAVRIGLLLAAGIWVLLACSRTGFGPLLTEEEICEAFDCAGHGRCGAVDGEAECLCDQGYERQGTDCVPIENPCLGVTCSGHGICRVEDESAYCDCDQDYRNPPGNQADCVPVIRCEGGDGTQGDDLLHCTMDDTCMGWVCEGVPGTCDDGDPCTMDACNEVEDTCSNDSAPDGSACEDGEFCTIGEICIGGICGGEFSRSCSDGTPCTEDFCDEENAICVNDVLQDGTPCEDGAWCTVSERCTDGVCAGAEPRDCSDGDPNTTDWCYEEANACVNDP